MICKRCGAQFEGNYCHICGEKVIRVDEPLPVMGNANIGPNQNVINAIAVAQKAQVKGCVSIIVIILSFIVILSVVMCLVVGEPDGKLDLRTSLIYASQDVVESNLKSPTSAKFPTSDDKSYKVRKTSQENIYYVSGYVDAQNSFGAMIRNNYTVKIQYFPKTDQYATLEVTIQ